MEYFMPSERTDIEDKFIIELLRLGNENAFNSVFRAYGKRVYSFCYGYLKSREDAEEMVQETFIRIWESRSTIDPDLPFGGFIFTIAYRLVLNRLRKRRYEYAGNLHWARNRAKVSNETEDSVIYRDLGRLAKDAIASLPPRRKQIYQMIKEDHMTYQQVAKTLNISTKTVEAQMTEALKYLRKSIVLRWFSFLAILFLS